MTSIISPGMNNRIASPFQKLANLFANVTPPADKTKILLSLGEPKHQPPQFVLNKLADSLARYPVTHGLSEYCLLQSFQAIKFTRFTIRVCGWRCEYFEKIFPVPNLPWSRPASTDPDSEYWCVAR